MGDKGLKVDPAEGSRLRSLKESVNSSVEKILGGHKASVYAKCFPSLIPKNEAVLESVRVSLIDKVRDAIYEDLQHLIDTSVAEPLEELRILVKNHTGPKDVQAWRPSGDPLSDIRAHDAKVLHYEKQRLVETLEQEHKKSEELLMKVKLGREQCHNNSLEIQNRLSVVSEAKDVCSSLSKDYMVSFCEEAITNFE
ncbi:polyamine-modulated factor 1-like [Palaemon carinicauda]|uniref:polyamine-modulated factor 1-like n=1 Tax=Palaemon carinicauda TaxID=392227 RepID=UPI0035B68F82